MYGLVNLQLLSYQVLLQHLLFFLLDAFSIPLYATFLNMILYAEHGIWRYLSFVIQNYNLEIHSACRNYWISQLKLVYICPLLVLGLPLISDLLLLYGDSKHTFFQYSTHALTL